MSTNPFVVQTWEEVVQGEIGNKIKFIVFCWRWCCLVPTGIDLTQEIDQAIGGCF